MGSPCIDLDMNLMSSPVPPERDCGNGGNKVDGFPAPSAAPEDRPSNGSRTPNDRATLDDVNGGDRSRPSRANSNFARGSTEGGEASNNAERMIVDGKTTLHNDAMTVMVESWREELYTMNVKNSIRIRRGGVTGSSTIVKKDGTECWTSCFF